MNHKTDHGYYSFVLNYTKMDKMKNLTKIRTDLKITIKNNPSPFSASTQAL